MALISLEYVTFSYRAEGRPALHDVSLTIEQGQWVSIIGPNGSGKSTLARVLTGLLTPQSGQVEVFGLPLDEEHLWDVRDRIGMVFQNPDNQFVGATVEDDVAFGMENRGVPRAEMVERVEQALETVGMSDFKEREPAALSGGQKQRVAIAGIMAIRPDVIILDEATSMLDPSGRAEVLRTVRRLQQERNLTVIAITHDIDETTWSDKIVVMGAGQVHHVGTPAEIYTMGTEGLARHGIQLPFAEELREELSRLGVAVPAHYLAEERLVEWAWTSGLKK